MHKAANMFAQGSKHVSHTQYTFHTCTRYTFHLSGTKLTAYIYPLCVETFLLMHTYLSLIACSLSGSVTTTCMPSGSLAFCRLKFRHAILALLTFLGIAIDNVQERGILYVVCVCVCVCVCMCVCVCVCAHMCTDWTYHRKKKRTPPLPDKLALPCSTNTHAHTHTHSLTHSLTHSHTHTHTHTQTHTNCLLNTHYTYIQYHYLKS